MFFFGQGVGGVEGGGGKKKVILGEFMLFLELTKVF